MINNNFIELDSPERENKRLKISNIESEIIDITKESKKLLLDFGIDSEPFSCDVMSCIPSNWSPSINDLQGRKDLREYNVFTIDPEQSKDLDGAFHCKNLGNNNYEVGVHIADVSYFVKPGSELDKCAANKATSVYLINETNPMLPRLLSEDYCSLLMGKDRLTFSIIWTMNQNGEIINEWFGKSIINSKSRLTYKVAQDIMDGNTTNSIKQSLISLKTISGNLKTKRVKDGVIINNNRRLVFKFKGVEIKSFKQDPVYGSTEIVEELNLLSNIRVANRICKYFPSNSILRKQPPPDKLRLEQFANKHISIFKFNTTDFKSFGKSFNQFKESNVDVNIYNALQLLSSRNMKKAEYICSENESWSHSSLNLDQFTQFTSPIRRYVDIVVHRLLDLSIKIDKANINQVLELNKQIPSSESIRTIATKCNEMNSNANKAQAKNERIYLNSYLSTNPYPVDSIVLNVGPYFMVVLVPLLNLEQKIVFNDQEPKIYASFDKTTQKVTISRSRKDQIIQKFSVIKIRLDEGKDGNNPFCSLVNPELF